MPTKLEMEETKILVPEIAKEESIDDKIKTLKPIDDLTIENFARELAANFNNPAKYSGIISGWFGRWQLNRNIKAATLFNQYLEQLRVASANATQLQEEILKNRIIFFFQVQLARQRVINQLALEKRDHERDMKVREWEMAQMDFSIRFFKETDPKNISETTLILLNMFTPRTVSSSSMFDSKSVQFGNPAEITGLKDREKLLELVMQEQMAKIRDLNAKARQQESQADVADVTAKATKKDFEKEK